MLDAAHPRILFHDVPDALLGPLSTLAGTSDTITGALTGSVHDSDWDLVVSFGERPYLGAGQHLLSFGGVQLPRFLHGSEWVLPTRMLSLRARALQVGEGVPNDVRGLIERTVIANDPGPLERRGFSLLPSDHVPLVTAGEERAVWAAAYLSIERLVWALPEQTTRHLEWLSYVLEALHGTDSTRFPLSADWRRGTAWGTPEVITAASALSDVVDERAAAIVDFDRREDAAREALESALASGREGAQRLLTEQGDALVDAVRQAFLAFEFEAHDMDGHHDAKTGAKLEDLRVKDGNWVGLVEVKGYSKGAKVNDLSQIVGRPALAFYKENQRDADALWHVVNAWRESDPSGREVALSRPNDLDTFAGNGGTLIDTRDLFRALRDVEAGTTTAAQVRESLLLATKRWTWPSSESPAAA
jgi:hypothetical protein